MWHLKDMKHTKLHTLYAWKSSMALVTSNFRALRNFTAVGWDTSPALCGCSLLRTFPRNSSTAWTNRQLDDVVKRETMTMAQTSKIKQ